MDNSESLNESIRENASNDTLDLADTQFFMRMHNFGQQSVLIYNEVSLVQSPIGQPRWTAVFDGECSIIQIMALDG